MLRLLLTSTVLAATSVPLTAFAQENSIMQSFHPEKYPAAKTEPGKQTEPDQAEKADKASPDKAKPARADK